MTATPFQSVSVPTVFTRAGETVLVPVSYRVSDGNLNLAGVGGVVLFDPTQLDFIGYTPAFSTDLFQKPDTSYSEADLYSSLVASNKTVNADLDSNAKTTAGVPFAYVTGSDATFDNNASTTWDGKLTWPNNSSASASTGLKLFDLQFKAKTGFSGSPLNALITTTAPGYSGQSGNGEAKLAATGTLTAPVISSISDDSGTSGDFITNDTTLLVTGTYDAINSRGGGAQIVAIDSAGAAITNGFDQTYTLGATNSPFTTGSQGTWTLDLTKTTLSQGRFKVTAFATDAENAKVSSEKIVTIDTTSPTLTITSSNESKLLKGQTATITFKFSEELANGTFSADDISVTNGAITGLTQSNTDKTTYTATFTPTASTIGTAQISVAASKVNDVAGNVNATATVSLQVATGTGYAIGTSSTSNEALVKLEGTGSNPTTYTFTVTRSGDISKAGSVTWTVKSSTTGGSENRLPGFLSAGGKVSASDFKDGGFPTGSLTFVANQTSQTFDVTVAADAVFEADESFVVELSNPLATDGDGVLVSGASVAAAIIVNDDAAPPRPVVKNPAFDLIGLTDLRNDPKFSAIDGKAPLLFNQTTTDYKNITVAVIDTGTDGSHERLSKMVDGDSKFIGYVDLVDGVFNPNKDLVLDTTKFIDNIGHGTHVSGSVGSNDPAIGVATGVQLIGLRVIDEQAQGTEVEEALQWVIQNRAQYNIVAVNMSLGYNDLYYKQRPGADQNDPLYDSVYALVKQLEDLGVTVVSAAGNDYVANHANNDLRENLSIPAIASSLAVGAVWKDGSVKNIQWGGGSVDITTGADRITSFSQRLSTYDGMLFAPGALIASTIPGNKVEEMGGTSMASPMVAGAVALLQDAALTFGQRLLTTKEVVSILERTAKNIYDGDDEDTNVTATYKSYKRMDIYSAVKQVEDMFKAPTVGSNNVLYYFNYYFGNGDSYSGYGIASSASTIYQTGLTPDSNNKVTVPNTTTNSSGQVVSGTGWYEITSTVAGVAGTPGEVTITSYVDADTKFGAATNVYGGGKQGLGSEKGDAYDGSGKAFDSSFDNSQEADIVQNAFVDIQKYNFVYRYSTKLSFNINENTTVAADLSGGNFKIIGGADGNLFSIDTATGLLLFKTAPNFEAKGSSAGDNSFRVNVQGTETATLNGNQTTLGVLRELTINVQDINEKPEFVSSTSSIELEENITAVTTLKATDPDLGDVQTFSIIADSSASAPGGSDGLFIIDSTSGALSFKSAPDYEKLTDKTFDLIVKVADQAGLWSTKSLSVTVKDKNEFAVAFKDPADSDGQPIGGSLASGLTPQIGKVGETYDGSVKENAPNGTLAGITAAAYDQDGTTNAITYALTDDAGGRFTIDAATGVVSVKNGSLIDYDDQPVPGDGVFSVSHTIKVKATSADTSSVERTFTIGVENIREDYPYFNSSGSRIIQENSTEVTTKSDFADGKAAATDPDGQGAPLAFSIESGFGDGNLFNVNTSTGELTFKTAPDFENKLDKDGDGTYVVRLKVTDNTAEITNANISQLVTVRIQDVDEYDASTPVDKDGDNGGSVNENAAPGSLVGITAFSSDLDGTTNKITYSLIGNDKTFAIDPDTGVVSMLDNASLDFETTPSQTLTVEATSADGSKARTDFTITVKNVNEGFTLTSPTNYAVPENQALVGQLSASDLDKTSNFSYAIVSNTDDDSAQFEITSAGVLQFKQPTDYENPRDKGSDNTYTFSVDITDVPPSGASGGPITRRESFTVSVTDIVETRTRLPGFLNADGKTSSNNVIDAELYTGTGYAAAGTYSSDPANAKSQILTDYGIYTITNTVTQQLPAQEAALRTGLVKVDSYYDFLGSNGIPLSQTPEAAPSFAVFVEAEGNQGLGSESGNAYNFFRTNPNSTFSNAIQADLAGEPTNYAYFTFTYYYNPTSATDSTAKGDYYRGFGYTLETDFGLGGTSNTNSSPKYGTFTGSPLTFTDSNREPNESAKNGVYVIDAVYENAPIDSSANNTVVVTSYFDSQYKDNTGSPASSVFGAGNSGLGSEWGFVADYDNVSEDILFGATDQIEELLGSDFIGIPANPAKRLEANLDYRGIDRDSIISKANKLGNLFMNTTGATTVISITDGGNSATAIDDGYSGYWIGRDREPNGSNTPDSEKFGGLIPEDIDLFEFTVDVNGIKLPDPSNNNTPKQVEGALVSFDTTYLRQNGTIVGKGADTILRLFDAYGKEIAMDDDSGIESGTSKIIANLLPGTYYLGVSGYDNSGYNPVVADTGAPADVGRYQLSLTTQPKLEILNRDRNGTLSTARYGEVAGNSNTGLGGAPLDLLTEFPKGFDVPVWISTDPINYNITGNTDNFYAVGDKDVDIIAFEVKKSNGITDNDPLPVTILTSPDALPLAYFSAYLQSDTGLANPQYDLSANTTYTIKINFLGESVSDFTADDILLYNGSAITSANGNFDASTLKGFKSDGTPVSNLSSSTANYFTLNFTTGNTAIKFDPGQNGAFTYFRIRPQNGEPSVGVVGAFDRDQNMDGKYDDPVDTVLRLFDKDGKEVAFSDDWGTDKYSRIDAELKPGVYYAAISGFGNSTYNPKPSDANGDGKIDGIDAALATDRYSAATGTATLSLIINPQLKLDPNGLLKSARDLIANPGEIISVTESLGTDVNPDNNATWKVSNVNDVDLYRIDTPIAGKLLIDTDTPASNGAKTRLRVFDARGVELATNTGSPEQDIAGKALETDAGGGSFIAVDVASTSTYYIGVSGSTASDGATYNPSLLDGRSNANTSPFAGAYTLNVSYSSSLGNNRELDADGFISEANDSAIQAIDLTSQNNIKITGKLVGDDVLGNNQEVGPTDVDFYKVSFAASGNTSPRILAAAVHAKTLKDSSNVAAPSKLDAVMELYTKDVATGTYVKINESDNQGDVSLTDPNDSNLDPYFQATLFPGTTYYLAVTGHGNEIRNPLVPTFGRGGSTGLYDLELTLAPAPRNEGRLVGFLNAAAGSASSSTSSTAVLQGTSPDWDLNLATSLEDSGVKASTDSISTLKLSPYSIDSSGLSLNGVLGSDSSTTNHPFAAIYRAALQSSSTTTPVSSDRIGADDVDIVPFKITTAGSYQINTRNQGDTLAQSHPTIKLFKANGEEITNSRINNPAPGLTEQHITTLQAGDYYAAILPTGSATSKFKLDTDSSSAGAGLQPGFTESLTDAQLREFSTSIGSYVFEIKAPKLETTTPTRSGTAVSLNMSAPISASNLTVIGATKSAAMVRTFNGAETEIKGSVIVDAKTNALSFVPTNPLDLAQPGSYEFRLNKSDLKVTAADGSLVLEPSAENALIGDGSATNQALQTTSSIEKTTVATISSTPKLVYIPSFARTLGQAVDLMDGAGIPVSITDTTGLRSIKLTFEFNPTNLTVPGTDSVTLSSALTSAGWTINGLPTLDIAAGRLTVDISGNTELPSSASGSELARIKASVPYSAIFKEGELLTISATGRSSTGSPVDIKNSSAMQKVSLIGDVDGDGSFSLNDSLQIRRLIAKKINGFSDFASTDPSILGDLDYDGTFSLNDVLQVRRATANKASTSEYALNSLSKQLMSNSSTNPDPKIRIGSASVTPGSEISVPVEIYSAESVIKGITSVQLKINYDSQILNLLTPDATSSAINATSNIQFAPVAGFNLDGQISNFGESGSAGSITLGFSVIDDLLDTGLIIDPTSVSETNPFVIGTLKFKVPASATLGSSADLTIDKSDTVNNRLFGWTSTNSNRAVQLTITETTKGSISFVDNRPTITITGGTTSTAIGPVDYTVTFSEMVTGFDQTKLTVAGGTVSNFKDGTDKGKVYTFTVTPNTSSTTPITVDIAAGVATGSTSSKTNAAATQSVQPVDTVKPTATITDNVAGTATGDVTYTLTFNKAVTNFTEGKIKLSNAAKGTFTAATGADAGKVFTLVATPTAGAAGNITLTVDAGAVTDAVGNTNAAAITNSDQAFDLQSPTLVITDSVANGDATGAVTFTFTFSEVVTGFSKSLITVSGGTAGDLTSATGADAGKVYTLVVTPPADTIDTLKVEVPTSSLPSIKDAVGNALAAAASQSQTFNTKAPSITISNNAPATAIADVTYTFTFSEAVTGFDASKVTVANGTKGTFTPATGADSGKKFTLVVTPTANQSGNITVDVAAGAATSVAASKGNLAATQNVVAFDTIKPSATITDNVSGTATGDVTYTLTFNKAVTNFTADKITLSNATQETFTAATGADAGKVFTLVTKPTAGSTGTITLSVAAGAVADAVGNTNAAAITNSDQAFDLQAPTLVVTDSISSDASVAATGSIQYTFAFSEVVSGFDINSLTITGGSASGGVTSTDNKTYALSVLPTANSSGNVVLALSNSNAAKIKDEAGNILATGTSATRPFVTKVVNADPTTPLSNIKFSESSKAIKTTFDANKITINPQTISFNLDAKKQQSNSAEAAKTPVTTTVDLSLVVPTTQLYDNGQRKANTFISYYTVDDSGNATPFLYDYEKKTGARFYNVGGRLLADLTFLDNQPGDKDPTVGVIRDPSVGGVSTFTGLALTATANVLTVADTTNTTAAAVNLKASVTTRPGSSNEIGFVLLTTGETPSSLKAADLISRGRVLFSTLENTDTTDFKAGTGVSLNNTLQITNGQNIFFYEVKDGVTAGIKTLDDINQLTPTVADGKATVKSSSGFAMELTLDSTEAGLASMLGRDQALAPLLNLNGLNTTDTITGTVVVTREADFNSTIGFYRVENIDGAVSDGKGGLILPTAANRSLYAAAAKNAIVTGLDGLKVDDNKSESSTKSFNATGGYLAPYAVVNGGTTYFAYAGANSDNFGHFKMLGNNVFGFEDWNGGGDKDFDDHVVAFTNLSLGPLA